jgi:hypothetical protein
MLIIPAIDLQKGKCVRLSQGRKEAAIVYDDDPVEVAKSFEQTGACMLHIVPQLTGVCFVRLPEQSQYGCSSVEDCAASPTSKTQSKSESRELSSAQSRWSHQKR